MITDSKWIKAPASLGARCPTFCRSFTLNGKVERATLRISAIGVYEASINGVPVSRDLFMPGWTSYAHRVQYQEYDLTDKLLSENTLKVKCGKGWAIGKIGFLAAHGLDNMHETTDGVALILELTLEYADGGREVIRSDVDFTVEGSEILSSDIYYGETVDLTAKPLCIGNAVIDGSPKPDLVSMIGLPVRERERVAAKELILTPKGERVIDFGQNLAGYVEIRYKGKRGDRITIDHAEILDFDGNFYTENMRGAKNVNIYVSDGNENRFHPTFSFQGFRYIRLSEYPSDEIDLSDFTAVAIYSDMERTGYFVSGNEKLNRLYSNIIWGQRSNYIDVPTDCPQRDERLGWTGDAEVFCRTAAINYSVKRFFEKWLGDMALEQGENGSVAGVVPEPFGTDSLISAAWGDAATVCPWEIYRAYGDRELLRSHFEMMKKWVGYMHSFGEDEFLYIGGNHYGDWVALDAGADQYVGATQTDLIASAYFAYSTELVVKAGRVLGEDVSFYEELYKNVRAAFRSAFMKNGLPTVYKKGDYLSAKRPILPVTQTAISLILRFGLCEECEREGLVSELVRLIDENGGRMSTGFVGTPHILHALSENGRADKAFDLLLQEKSPSWLFSVNMGATTVWEHWDGIREDGSYWSTDMNSFNHYAYGAVYDWMFGVMVGIDIPDGGEGYRKIVYSPHPDPRVGFARASVDTVRGRISAGWSYTESGRVRFELDLPEGTEAEVIINERKLGQVSCGSHVFWM